MLPVQLLFPNTIFLKGLLDGLPHSVASTNDHPLCGGLAEQVIGNILSILFKEGGRSRVLWHRFPMGDVGELLLAAMHEPHDMAINGHGVAVLERDGLHNFKPWPVSSLGARRIR